MLIRHSTPADLPAMLRLYEKARQFMAENGNPLQWGPTRWPPEEVLRADMDAGKSYVCEQCGRVCGTFYYDFGESIEPTYRKISDGAWKNPGPYGVVHRIAVDTSQRGIGTFCLKWALTQSPHLRIDTHPDNHVMQGLLLKLGFVQCGIIYVREDPMPRLAFEHLSQEDKYV